MTGADKPSFVFKGSRQKEKIALNINRNGYHFLKNEFCYFDGKYRRCRGFVTLTASVYHTLLRKQVILGTMEAEAENSGNVALFWQLFNEMLRKVSSDENETFDPIGWCTDLAGANLAGLCSVYGEAIKSRIKTVNSILKITETKRQIDWTEKAPKNLNTCAVNFLKVLPKTNTTLKKRLDSFRRRSVRF